MVQIVAWKADDGRIFEDYSAYKKDVAKLNRNKKRSENEELAIELLLKEIRKICSEVKNVTELKRIVRDR
jgi:hypothetical protein